MQYFLLYKLYGLYGLDYFILTHMSLAIYRKYRPLSFSDLLGQETIVKILREAAKQDRLSHAYLLSGPRGTGKTTTARLIAKIANGEKRRTDQKVRAKGEPCNECRACEAIDKGRSLDVVEIDAASNRGIDEIRNLKENVRVSPTELSHKVFIIDEAHMLTKEAFNALLKTLEEPPQYVIMILATTEVEKIPATIASRSQQLHFKRIAILQIAEKLARIAEKENVTMSKEALDLIASSGEGSFRDAESLLDQLISFGKTSVTLEDVEKLVGKVGFGKISELAGFLLGKNIDGALHAISEIQEGGYNIAQVAKDLIQYIRRTAVLKYSPEIKDMFLRELTDDHLKILIRHSELFQEEHIGLLKLLIEAYGNMRYSQFPIIPLEVAVIEGLK